MSYVSALTTDRRALVNGDYDECVTIIDLPLRE